MPVPCNLHDCEKDQPESNKDSIPDYLSDSQRHSAPVHRGSREGAQGLRRTFTPKSHVAATLYCQVSKTESLNSICDVAAANETLWTSMGVTVPRRNTFSNTNAVRPSAIAKDLYWRMYGHLAGIAPKFGHGPHRGYCFRIKAPISAVDSSTIKLKMNSIN